jgi:hypothetical protein
MSTGFIHDSGHPIGKPDYIISSPTLVISKVPAGNFAPCSKPTITLSFLKPPKFPTGYFLCSIFTNILRYATHRILHTFEKKGQGSHAAFTCCRRDGNDSVSSSRIECRVWRCIQSPSKHGDFALRRRYSQLSVQSNSGG